MGAAPPAADAKLSCTQYFDALYFCLSPVHQVDALYRRGEFDTCNQTGRDWLDCMANKARPDPAIQVREASPTRGKR